jgi:nicotinamide-nucleotide amidase
LFQSSSKLLLLPVIHHQLLEQLESANLFLLKKSPIGKSPSPHISSFAYLPGLGEVKLRLTGIGASIETLKAETDVLTQKLEPLVGTIYLWLGDDPIEVVIGKKLLQKKLTLSIAESCTVDLYLTSSQASREALRIFREV